MIWQPKTLARELSEPHARACAATVPAIHRAGYNFGRQRVRSGSPERRCPSPADLAQPPKTAGRVGSLPKSSRVPPSPQVQCRAPQTRRSTLPKLESQKTGLQACNNLQSDCGLQRFQHQLLQSTSIVDAQSQFVEQLLAFIGSELQACFEALTAAQEAFMTDVTVILEARLEANSLWRNNCAAHVGNLQTDVHRLESNLNEMDMRLGKVASQQLSAQAEQQVFETQVVGFFEVIEECLQGLHQGTSSSDRQLASISRAKTAECHNAVETFLQGSGGQLHGLTKRSSASSTVATGKCKHVPVETKHRQMTSPSPECVESQQEGGSSTPWTGTLIPETSFRVEALEMALASMQEQEQERICRLKERIHHLQKQ